jgi:hypothetical protein
MSWNSKKRKEIVNSSMDSNSFISNDEYQIKMKTDKAMKANKKRRKGAYADALSALSEGIVKTSLVSKNIFYYLFRKAKR